MKFLRQTIFHFNLATTLDKATNNHCISKWIPSLHIAVLSSYSQHHLIQLIFPEALFFTWHPVPSWFSYHTGHSFSSQLLNFGIPQSSILRPVLFLVFLYFLVDFMQSLSFQYHLCNEDSQDFISSLVFLPEFLIHVSTTLLNISTWKSNGYLKELTCPKEASLFYCQTRSFWSLSCK